MHPRYIDRIDRCSNVSPPLDPVAVSLLLEPPLGGPLLRARSLALDELKREGRTGLSQGDKTLAENVARSGAPSSH